MTRPENDAVSGLGRTQGAWPAYAWIAVTVGVSISIASAVATVWRDGDLAPGLYYLALQNIMRQADARLIQTIGGLLLGLLVLDVAMRRTHLPSKWRQFVTRVLGARFWRRSGLAAFAAAVALNAAGRYRDVVTPTIAPNVILIVIDTLRADHVGSYGAARPTTPHMDAFAAEAVRFRAAYSSSAWTRPAVASILTATTPFEHGITADTPEQVLPSSFLTIPEYLRNRHYWAAAFITNAHYRFGIDQNFDEAHYCANCPADRVYDQVLAFIDTPRRGPFFLLVHNNDPHDAYEFHAGFSTTPADSPYRVLEAVLPSRIDGTTLDADSELNRSGTVILAAAALEEMKRNYDGEIAFVDHQIGRLLATLRQRGLLQHTIVVITADHGEEFLDHGSYWHGATLFEELIRVPLLLYAPGLGSAVVDTPVGTIDVFPTLVDLLGGPALPQGRVTGQSLLPLLRGGPQPPRTLVAATALRSQLKYAVIRDTDKLISFANGDPIGLFDLRDDPSEQHNRCDSDARRCAALSGALVALARNSAGASGPQPPAVAVDESVRQQLRALGYGGK